LTSLCSCITNLVQNKKNKQIEGVERKRKRDGLLLGVGFFSAGEVERREEGERERY